jgi:hypothetical protein
MGHIAIGARAGARLALVGVCLVLANAGSAGQVPATGGPARLFARSEVVRPPGLIPHVTPPSRAPKPQNKGGVRGSAEPPTPSRAGQNPRSTPGAAPVFPPVTPLE